MPPRRRTSGPQFHIGAPVAQLDRVSGYEPEGREFESLQARQLSPSTDFLVRARRDSAPALHVLWAGLRLSPQDTSSYVATRFPPLSSITYSLSIFEM